jgi:integrase/recombinase XerD
LAARNVPSGAPDSRRRPQPDEGFLFLAYHGRPFNADYFGHEVRKYVIASGVGKEGACHLFRHTMATLMLDGGADIRYVQEMLGHAKLTTTSIYTQVSIDRLKKVHEATHPGARLKPGSLTISASADEKGVGLDGPLGEAEDERR